MSRFFAMPKAVALSMPPETKTMALCSHFPLLNTINIACYIEKRKQNYVLR
jgi:hypothetical protein